MKYIFLLICTSFLLISPTNAQTTEEVFEENENSNKTQIDKSLYIAQDVSTLFSKNKANGITTDTVICQLWDSSANVFINDEMNVAQITNDVVTADVNFFWNGSNWELKDSTSYEYNNMGQITLLNGYLWSNTIWVSNTSQIINYNTYGKEILNIYYYNWGGLNWNSGEKDSSIYTSDSLITLKYISFKSNNDWDLFYKTEYTYDSTKWIVQDVMYTNSSNWEKASKNEYVNLSVSGLVSESIYYYWDGTDWIKTWKYNYEYDINNNLFVFLFYEIKNQTWEVIAIDTTIYNSTNLLVNRTYHSYYNSNIYNAFRYSFTYDSSGNISSYLYEAWNGTVLEYQYQYAITYNEYDAELYSYLWNGSIWSNYMYCWLNYKPDYSGINETSQEWGDISIFPNPASETINITFSDMNLINSFFTIYDSRGSIVYSNKLNSNNTLLNIEDFPAGLYYYTINEDNRGKIIINSN
jgi:hypothetical protein